MQGWNEQTGWEDGGYWPGRPDNGAADPAVRAGRSDDPAPEAAAWRDEPTLAANWHDDGPGQVTDWSAEPPRSTGGAEEQQRGTDWGDEPDRAAAWGAWGDEPPRGTGWDDEPQQAAAWGDEPGRLPSPDEPDRLPDPDERGRADEITELWRRAGLDRVDEPIGRREHAAARWADEPAELGAFELGRQAEGGRRVRPGGGRPDGGGDRGGSGRHRRPTRLRGPVGLGVAVTALLGVFGAGAALLPPSLADAPADNRGGQPAVEAAGPEDITEPEVAEPAPTASAEPSATPTPTATRPAAKPKATSTAPRPPRTTSPAARRTPERSGPGAGAAGSSQANQVLAIVNQERTAAGCGTVTLNADLTEAAQLHSEDQGEHTNMSHTGSDGSDFVERARRAGYSSPIGENVAMGYETPAAVMDGWMNSSGHRANILNCNARAMGLGVATGADGRLYWTQMFGSVA